MITTKERLDKLLIGLKEPKTMPIVEFLHGVNKNHYASDIIKLEIEGYVINLGKANRAIIWQAINFDYMPPQSAKLNVEIFVAPMLLPVVIMDAPLSRPSYVHKMENLSEKYKLQQAQTRKEYKSARAHVSGAQTYASF